MTFSPDIDDLGSKPNSARIKDKEELSEFVSTRFPYGSFIEGTFYDRGYLSCPVPNCRGVVLGYYCYLYAGGSDTTEPHVFDGKKYKDQLTYYLNVCELPTEVLYHGHLVYFFGLPNLEEDLEAKREFNDYLDRNHDKESKATMCLWKDWTFKLV